MRRGNDGSKTSGADAFQSVRTNSVSGRWNHGQFCRIFRHLSSLHTISGMSHLPGSDDIRQANNGDQSRRPGALLPARAFGCGADAKRSDGRVAPEARAQRAARAAMARITIQPTITRAAIAPAVIFAFCLHVVEWSMVGYPILRGFVLCFDHHTWTDVHGTRTGSDYRN